MRSPGRTGLLVPGGDRLRRTVVLLSDEPAGKIATRTAGAIELEATLSWQSAEDTPPELILPKLDGIARRIAVTEGPETGTRRLTGEIRAFTQAELAFAFETVLREITTVAALTEAVLEVGAVRSVPPGVASRQALEELARDLWDAGFGVLFGPSWAPAPGADVCVGGGGDLHEFLRAHPSWSVA